MHFTLLQAGKEVKGNISEQSLFEINGNGIIVRHVDGSKIWKTHSNHSVIESMY